ncbi:hypothetical protein E8E14_006890 [Neopestalotiopsis sp. 37M]|nr:hypothetical protein E8E14_006890 [Neopestalotiopsis sp. 37M]
MPRESESLPSSQIFQTETSSPDINTVAVTSQRLSVPRVWHCKSPMARQPVASLTGCEGGMLQHWVEEDSVAQPYHIIAEVVFSPEANRREEEVERPKVDSQVAQAGSQDSAQ